VPISLLATTLQRSADGSLRSSERTGKRRLKEHGLMFDHDAREATQHHLDAALQVDPSARAVDVTYPDGDTLDGVCMLPQFLAKPSPNVRAVFVVELDPIDADIRRRHRRSRTPG
jgi:hypothetical protein